MAPPDNTDAVAEERNVSDSGILARVHHLIAEEKALRAGLVRHQMDETDDHRRLRSLETELDQCWDLLRQRRALRDAGGDPREATDRPADEVEGYTG